MLANNAPLTDVSGNSVQQVHVLQDQYFIVTPLGIYQSNTSFLFPKLLFEPTAKALNKSEAENVTVQYNARERE